MEFYTGSSVRTLNFFYKLSVLHCIHSVVALYCFHYVTACAPSLAWRAVTVGPVCCLAAVTPSTAQSHSEYHQ